MANAAAVARSMRLFRDRALSPAAQSAVLAGVARKGRDELIRRGEAPTSYRTFVDGREGAREEAVRPDGTIVYRFNLLPAAVGFALALCVARSPVRSGRYRKSWFVMVNGRRWTGDMDAIPADATVFVTNDQPYSRKIDTGAMKLKVPPGIVEAARQAVQRQYPFIRAERDFLLLPGDGKRGGYVLRTHGGSRRKDRQAGQRLTYPALVLRVG